MEKCKHYVAPFCGHPSTSEFTICPFVRKIECRKFEEKTEV